MQENTERNSSSRVLEDTNLLPENNEESSKLLVNENTNHNKDNSANKSDSSSRAVHSQGRRLTAIAEELSSTEESRCGIWCVRGRFLQRFANKKAYVILYGILGSIMIAGYSYLNGTITTLEKQFKIPSTNTGMIMAGSDISQMALCVVLNYYGGRGHRPRWIAFGVGTVVIFCIMNALPHLLYGAGEESLALTEEFGAHLDINSTAKLIDGQNRKALCQESAAGGSCDDTTGNFAPQVILFCAQLVSGIGGSLFHTLGIAYMDDNIQRSKSPALISVSFFLRMLGPACGYALASACLSLYVSPSLTPTITTKDPRWLGAWWLGWLFLGGLLFVFSWVLALFPRTLPRAAARKVLASERRKEGITVDPELETHIPTSFEDMMKTFKRLILNKTLMCNCMASVFYFMGYVPYWLFMPKYIETIYKQSASAASFITGAVGLVFSAIGILASGMFISKFRPSARFLAAWNVLVGVCTTLGIFSYMFLGCPVNDQQGSLLASGQMDPTTSCNADCHCDYVKYAPVCSPDGRTFISPCHAGCRDYHVFANGSKAFFNCSCAPTPPFCPPNHVYTANSSVDHFEITKSCVVTEGPCSVDCTTMFYIFLVIVCALKFIGATGITSNFLVSIRCVDDKDKTTAMGLGIMMMSLFAFIPGPILYGYVIDQTCLVWGKTCSGTGNCWLYNADSLTYYMNTIAAGFLSVGTLFDVGVWFYVKSVKIFEDDVETELKQQIKSEKKEWK